MGNVHKLSKSTAKSIFSVPSPEHSFGLSFHWLVVFPNTFPLWFLNKKLMYTSCFTHMLHGPWTVSCYKCVWFCKITTSVSSPFLSWQWTAYLCYVVGLEPQIVFCYVCKCYKTCSSFSCFLEYGYIMQFLLLDALYSTCYISVLWFLAELLCSL